MLSSENFLKILVKAHQTSPYLCGQMFTYIPGATECLQVIPKGGTRIGYFFRFLLLNCVALLCLSRIFKSLNTLSNDVYMRSPRLEKSLCIMMITVCSMIAERYRVRGKFPKDFTTFYNGVLLVEANSEKGFHYNIFRKCKMGKHALFLTQVVAKWVAAPTIAITCAIDPEIPFNALWFFERFKNHIDSTLVQKLYKVVTCVLNYFFWQMTCIQGYRLTTDILIGTMSLTLCLQVAHRNLSQAFRNDKMNKSNTTTNCHVEYMSYRSMHLMVYRYNKMMITLLFVVLVTLGVVQTVSVTTIILCKNSGVPIYLTIFLIVSVTQSTMLIIVAYGFAGDFNQESTKSLRCLKRQNRLRIGSVSRQEFLYAQRFLASCQTQRIQFGLSNFIEKRTPLVFQLYCMDRIIDLLLVK